MNNFLFVSNDLIRYGWIGYYDPGNRGKEVLRDNRITKLVTARTVHFYSVCESPRQRPEVLGCFGLGRGQWASGL